MRWIDLLRYRLATDTCHRQCVHSRWSTQNRYNRLGGRADGTSDARDPQEVKISPTDKGLVPQSERRASDYFSSSASSIRGKSSDSMQTDRVLAAFLSWDNKADRNAAEQSSVNVTADDAVTENGSEVAAYQPRVSSPPVNFSSAGAQRSNSPNVLQYEPQIRKCPPVSLVADKYMILDELEGSSLNMCVNIRTKEDFVCKVRRFGILLRILEVSDISAKVA